MAAKKKAAKAGRRPMAVQESPYVQRVVEDEDLRENLWQAYESARDAAWRLSNGKSPTKAIFDDKKLQKDLKRRPRPSATRRVALREAPKQAQGPGFGRLLLLTHRRRRAWPLAVSARACARRCSTRCSAPRRSSSTPRRRPRRPRRRPRRRRRLRARAPRPAAAGYPRGSRPPRRPRSRAPSRRRRAPSAAVRVLGGLLGGLEAVEDLLHQVLGPVELEREHARPTNTTPSPGPAAGSARSRRAGPRRPGP